MPSNIYSRAMMRGGRQGQGQIAQLLAQESQDNAFNDRMQETQSKDAWQQNYQQQQLGLRNQQLQISQSAADLQNAKQAFLQEKEKRQIAATQAQLQAGTKVYQALGTLDPYDVDLQKKVLALRAQYPEAFKKSANGVDTSMEIAEYNTTKLAEMGMENITTH